MKSVNYEFNAIVIIESLETNQEKTGYKLKEYLIERFQNMVQIIYYDVNTKVELYNLFEELINYSNEGLNPILHLEIHGHKSNLGLQLKNGDLVNWQYLYVYCKELNLNLKNNLFLTLAVCRGAHLMRKVQPFDRCPWGFILASFKDIWSNEIFRDFSTFYEILLTKKNIELAYNEICRTNPNADFEIIDSDKTFSIVKENFNLRIEDEKLNKTHGNIMFKSFTAKNPFEKVREELNVKYNAQIITEEDLINYFSNNYLHATLNLVSDFKRFFYFWQEV